MHSTIKISLLFSILILIYGCHTSIGAGYLDQSTFSVSKALDNIKTGGTIVRLSVENTKLLAMEKVINDPTTSETYREELRKMVIANRNERIAYVREVISEFNDNYKLGPIYFLPDSNFSKFFRAHNQSSLFYNDSGKIDPSIQVPESNFVYMIQEDDYEFKYASPTLGPIAEPFPTKVGVNFFSGLLRGLAGTLNGPGRLRKDLEKYQEKIKSLRPGY